MAHSTTSIFNLFGFSDEEKKAKAARLANLKVGNVENIEHELTNLKMDVILGDEAAIERAKNLFALEQAAAGMKANRATVTAAKPKPKKAKAKAQKSDGIDLLDFVDEAVSAGHINATEAAIVKAQLQASLAIASEVEIPKELKGKKLSIPMKNGSITISID